MILSSLKKQLSLFFNPKKFAEPDIAYNIWANAYDDQPGNLIFYLDEKIINDFLNTVDLSKKVIADVGCGTGRHWKIFFSKHPGELIGYDVSEKMLQKLQEKYPASKTFLLLDNNLSKTKSEYCDVIISTLVIAHIKDIESAFKEWNRVLKKGGNIFITDFHPSALESGATRSFRHNDEMIHIRNYIYSVEYVKALAEKMNWKEINFTEAKINEEVRHFFKGKEALSAYQKNYNMPLVYGFLFRKAE